MDILWGASPTPKPASTEAIVRLDVTGSAVKSMRWFARAARRRA